MFQYTKHVILRPFVKTEHTKDGHYYRTEKGALYPSITTVFKLLDNKEWYGYWVQSIMKKMDMSETEAEIECKRIGNESMEVGNKLHLLAEAYLNNKTTIVSDQQLNDLFTPLMDHLDEHVNNVNGTELELYSDELQLAGTADCIAQYDGVMSIIDFKNSRKPKSKSECKKKNYFQQLCAYGKMWECCTGQKIEQGVNLIISWDGKIRPYVVKLADYEEDLLDTLIKYEHFKALNTT